MIDRKRVDALLDAALDLPPEERALFLERECYTPELRQAVERLLSASEREATERQVGGALWQQLAAEMAAGSAGTLSAGDRLGAYRIVSELGRGGMALVYLAERADGQYEQTVALKILERSTSDARSLMTDAVARFERERRILASLEHPGIARILDGGLARDGRPWFAMEYVEGSRIDAYCDEHQLSVRERLQLFAEVARTVAAAHRQLVVHRDIKPSNILVSKEGRPKLLDFGIAKLLEPERASGPDAELTHALVPMTPRYASPEQASGRPVTTASDVYQLGLLLFELLAGVRAFEFAGSTPSELREGTASREATRPSVAVEEGRGAAPTGEQRARNRGLHSVRQLRRLLVGDLDTIVLAALRPQPERRYESAARLAEDVERYLAGRPILARPDAWTYRTRKFVERNRWAVAAGAAGLAAIVGLSVFYTVRLREERDTARREEARAEKEAEKASRVSQFLVDLFKASDPYMAKQVARRTALELLDEGAKKIEGGPEATLAADATLEGQPEIEAAMLHTIGAVYRHLGQYPKAERLLRKAAELRERVLGREHADTLRSLEERAVVLRSLDQQEEALALFREVLAARERQLDPRDPAVAVSLTDVALVLDRLERREEARPLVERAIAIFEQAPVRDADRLSHAHWVLGAVLANSGDSAAGIEQTRQAIALLRDEVDADHPRLPGLLSELGWDLWALGRLDEAHAAYAEALRVGAARLAPEHPHVAWIRVNAAAVEAVLEHDAEALAMVDQSLPIARAALGDAHYGVAMAHHVRAQALLGLGRAPEALREIDLSQSIYRKAYGDDSEDMITTSCDRAAILARLGRRVEAHALLLSLAEKARVRPEHRDHLTSVLVALGKLDVELGRAAEALAALDEAIAVDTERRPDGSSERVTALGQRARALLLLGRREEARTALARALALAESVQGVTPRLRDELHRLEGGLGP